MPLVGTSPATARIKLEDRRCPLDGADGRMRNQFPQADGKPLLFGIIEMLLIAEENNLVLEKHLVDRTDGLVGQITRQLDIPDLRTEACRALDDIGSRNDVIDGGRISHGRGSQAAILCQTMLRRSPVAAATAEMR
jgi:hypothetical protein